MSFAGGEIALLVLAAVSLALAVACFMIDRSDSEVGVVFGAFLFAIFLPICLGSAHSHHLEQQATKALNIQGFHVLSTNVNVKGDNHIRVSGPGGCVVTYDIKHYLGTWRVLNNAKHLITASQVSCSNGKS
ncbi:MAG TPA: hypothetical protein VG992_05030 [Candidatus Saccharimonadales bacterium]|nr:hypothetical protein [Candidatus Saccharimonadales bacterium]